MISGQCILLRTVAMALLSACCVAGLWDSGCLPCSLLPVARNVIELHRAMKSKRSVLPLLRVCIPDHNTHVAEGRKGAMEAYESLIQLEWQREICRKQELLLHPIFLFSSLPKTYHRSLDNSKNLQYCSHSGRDPWRWSG